MSWAKAEHRAVQVLEGQIEDIEAEIKYVRHLIRHECLHFTGSAPNRKKLEAWWADLRRLAQDHGVAQDRLKAELEGGKGSMSTKPQQAAARYAMALEAEAACIRELTGEMTPPINDSRFEALEVTYRQAVKERRAACEAFEAAAVAEGLP